MRIHRWGAGLLATAALVVAAGCKVDDTTSTAIDPASGVGPNGDGGPSAPPPGGPGADGGGDAACVPSCAGRACGKADGCGGACNGPCPGGEGCGVDGACVPCTKSCGPNGACVAGWEGGAHCECAPGFYETLSGCSPSAGTPCDGIACSGHGTCSAAPPINSPECRCDGDYVSYGLACAPRSRLRCVDADGSLKDRGTIRCNAANTAFEVCRDGNGDGDVEWVASGSPACAAGSTCSACLGAKCDNGDGTGGQPCPTGTVCMGKVHEVDVYQCQASCDCTNCGTCDPGQFTGYQRSCGSSTDDLSSATKACTLPCPHAGDGCLPYGAFAFCFPNEGCASAAPK